MGIKDLSENLESIVIEIGASEDLASHDPLDVPFNVVLVHRHPEWLLQKWGNACSFIVSRMVERAAYDMPVRWYHKKLFNFCYDQYDKYGDYYRVLDNSFGTSDTDGIREVQ